MAWTWQRADWRTMNYGFAPAEGDTSVPPMPELSAEDEPDRYCFGLYHRVAAQRDLTGRDVLEVGSGRGGGASYVHRYLGPSNTTGLDRSSAAIKLASEREDSPGLSYVVGDAEELPFPDNHVDVVINVESCHCYGSIPLFLEEVFRVLRPGGALLLADLRLSHLQSDFDAELNASPFQVRHRTDITADVVRSLKLDTPRRQKLMAESASFGLRTLMKWFSGVQGSTTYRDLDSRRFVYHCYELHKPGPDDAKPAAEA
jgi:ubiquinone/menaquinone biosynthesis C-methylase UbiE